MDQEAFPINKTAIVRTNHWNHASNLFRLAQTTIRDFIEFLKGSCHLCIDKARRNCWYSDLVFSEFLGQELHHVVESRFSCCIDTNNPIRMSSGNTRSDTNCSPFPWDSHQRFTFFNQEEDWLDICCPDFIVSFLRDVQLWFACEYYCVVWNKHV